VIQRGSDSEECLAKGVWFVTARRVLETEYGPDALARVTRRLGDEHSGPLVEPFASSWYPETALQRAMNAVSTEVCDGDPDRFCEFIEACTVVGINRFLRVLLTLTSPAFTLSKMPILWGRHRRNNGTLHVDMDAHTARLHYRGFPFFGDVHYRVLVRGILSKTMEISSGERPDVTVRDWGSDRLEVTVHFTNKRLRDA
jgi:hypothetical protein